MEILEVSRFFDFVAVGMLAFGFVDPCVAVASNIQQSECCMVWGL